MLNQRYQLIIIRQEPHPHRHPFLNPISRRTHPKSLEHQNIRTSQTDKDLQPTSYIHHSCCPNKNVKAFSIYKKSGRKATMNSVVPAKTNSRQLLKKVQKATSLLPKLKRFHGNQLMEVESSHKICQSDNCSRLNVENLTQLSGANIMTAVSNRVKGKLRNKYISSEHSEITQNGCLELSGKPKQPLYQRVGTQQPPNEYREYFQHLSQSGDPLRRAHSHQKENREHSQDEIVTQKSLRNELEDKNATMFHHSKNKLEEMVSKQSQKPKLIRSNSLLSNGLFNIPEEQEYGDYLSSYTPVDPHFDLQNLVKAVDFHIIPDEGKVYFGQVVGSKRHGKGITITPQSIYEGQYQADLKVQGCQKNRDGVYIGEYLHGRRHGKGKFAWYNGEWFEGQWSNGKKNGFGVWKSQKGDYYQGEWAHNRQNGTGYHYHIGGSSYRGSFKDFLKHGSGKQQFPNGDVYFGSYLAGRPHGQGRYHWANGDTYQGAFYQGSRSGFGKLTTKKGQIYEGGFKNDLKHGMGKERLSKNSQQIQGIFYEGVRQCGL